MHCSPLFISTFSARLFRLLLIETLHLYSFLPLTWTALEGYQTQERRCPLSQLHLVAEQSLNTRYRLMKTQVRESCVKFQNPRPFRPFQVPFHLICRHPQERVNPRLALAPDCRSLLKLQEAQRPLPEAFDLLMVEEAQDFFCRR